MICNYCKTDKDLEDMTLPDMCDICFDKMMDEEEKDFEIYAIQGGKCFICNRKLGLWITKPIDGEKRAICCKHI
jgi:hypothetical protein